MLTGPWLLKKSHQQDHVGLCSVKTCCCCCCCWFFTALLMTFILLQCEAVDISPTACGTRAAEIKLAWRHLSPRELANVVVTSEHQRNLINNLLTRTWSRDGTSTVHANTRTQQHGFWIALEETMLSNVAFRTSTTDSLFAMKSTSSANSSGWIVISRRCVFGRCLFVSLFVGL